MSLFNRTIKRNRVPSKRTELTLLFTIIIIASTVLFNVNANGETYIHDKMHPEKVTLQCRPSFWSLATAFVGYFMMSYSEENGTETCNLFGGNHITIINRDAYIIADGDKIIEQGIYFDDKYILKRY